MSNVIQNFENEVLSKELMRNVKGGNPPIGGVGTTAYITCKDANQEEIGELEIPDGHCIDALCECDAVYGNKAQYASCFAS